MVLLLVPDFLPILPDRFDVRIETDHAKTIEQEALIDVAKR